MFTCSLLHFCGKDCAAPSRGHKVRANLFPAEHSLALFVCDIEDPDESWVGYNAACDWFGVTVNQARFVTEIRWSGMGLQGTLQWKHLPATVEVLEIGAGFRDRLFRQNHLQGTLDFSLLPPCLVWFSATANDFSGTLDFTQLPPSLRHLGLHGNQFNGEVDLTNLPPNIEHIFIGKNLFSGRLDFSKLPGGLKRLEINKYRITYSGKLPDCVFFD